MYYYIYEYEIVVCTNQKRSIPSAMMARNTGVGLTVED
jgi:hypothetical protein